MLNFDQYGLYSSLNTMNFIFILKLKKDCRAAGFNGLSDFTFNFGYAIIPFISVLWQA